MADVLLTPGEERVRKCGARKIEEGKKMRTNIWIFSSSFESLKPQTLGSATVSENNIVQIDRGVQC